MANVKIDIGGGQKFVISQGVGDLMSGIRMGDLSRISAYSGRDLGVHTGSRSQTLGRRGTRFGSK